MRDFSDAASRQKRGISDLPDEVFVLILMLLPFPDQVRVRRVSTYWRTAVHFLFAKLETVSISLQENEKYESEIGDWELDSLGFNFDSGIHIVYTHPPGQEPFHDERKNHPSIAPGSAFQLERYGRMIFTFIMKQLLSGR